MNTRDYAVVVAVVFYSLKIAYSNNEFLIELHTLTRCSEWCIEHAAIQSCIENYVFCNIYNVNGAKIQS